MAGHDIERWGDAAMYEAQPMQTKEDGPEAVVTPRVYLQSATPDPLGALAAGMRMYRGDPPYTLDEVTDEERRWAWDESIKTHLKAPWEFIDFQFMIEAVTRSFTHQMVRQRVGAVYAQESLRFAVKRGMAEECAIPPSVINNENASAFWSQTLDYIQRSYDALISMGIPAEDARGLLPHCTTTRIIYKTNFRGLIEHAGNRLCTQAQFEWRAVFLEIMKAIKNYDPVGSVSWYGNKWQFELIATARAETFSPVCYKAGKCVFMSELDRGCTIRDRVNAFAAAGVPSTKWGIEGINWAEPMGPINPMEWMANPRAGITETQEDRPH